MLSKKLTDFSTGIKLGPYPNFTSGFYKITQITTVYKSVGSNNNNNMFTFLMNDVGKENKS